MKNLFNSIKLQKPATNVFDLTHDVKLSCNMGQLVPIMVTETIPGDKFNISCESLLRFAPLVSPVMHRMDITMHYFFVPNRIIWPGWEGFITQQGGAAFPTVDIDAAAYASSPLADYLGLPIPLGGNIETVSALPFAAYQMIYNEYYRDQNLIADVPFELGNGDNSGNLELYKLRKRAWEHDYFTSALPFAQKGAAVTLPIAGFEDVVVKYSSAANTTLTGAPTNIPVTGQISAGIPAGQLYADTSELGVNSTTINDLRKAFRLQEFLEKQARGGTRYTEQILSQFGVKSSDKRLNRPEYITGLKSPVIISEVLNTSDTTNAPQGEMAGHGIAVVSGKYGNYFCEEHGYIIGIMSVLPKTAYQQGIPKHFLKYQDLYQFYWPSFAHIGEQEVLNKEVYAFAAGGDNTFGYVPRYAEHKFEQNRVAGDFRTSLDFWHLGRIFSAPPNLGQTFIECDSTSTDRVFAVTTPAVQKLYAHVLNRVKAVRPMPKFGTPTF